MAVREVSLVPGHGFWSASERVRRWPPHQATCSSTCSTTLRPYSPCYQRINSLSPGSPGLYCSLLPLHVSGTSLLCHVGCSRVSRAPCLRAHVLWSLGAQASAACWRGEGLARPQSASAEHCRTRGPGGGVSPLTPEAFLQTRPARVWSLARPSGEVEGRSARFSLTCSV